MDPGFLVMAEIPFAPLAWAAPGAAAAVLFWLAARARPQIAVPLRFLAIAAGTWFAVCILYMVVRPEPAFGAYLMTSTLVTEIIAVVGTVCYVAGLVRFTAGERRWRDSSALVAGVALMGSAFVRAAYQPTIAVTVEAPTALLLAATVWRLRAEPLVHLSLLALAVTVVLGARHYLAAGSQTPVTAWVTSTAAGVSLLMVIVAALLGFHPRQEFNVKWYRQGLMIVPLLVASLAAMGAGYVAVWHGTSWHTVWALGVWWAVLLESAIGLRQADLFGFSCVSAGLAALAAFAVLGGDQAPGYAGRYPTVLLAIALGAALLAGLLKPLLTPPATRGFPRALYLAGVALAAAALLAEPFVASPLDAKPLGWDLLIAAAVLALAHVHRAPAWVNYLVALLATGGAAALGHLGSGAKPTLWHHRFIQVTAAAAIAWLAAALVVREVLKRTASDRTARRQSLPLTVTGMATTLVLAAYLSVQEIRTYAQFLFDGNSPTRELLGPLWGLAGWLAILLAFLLSMWLVRHTARTFLFYVFGVMATAYAGLFGHTGDLYGYLICAVAGYGASHLLVYLYEAKFMALLSRTCALYREERRASTTIFTLAVVSCFVGALLAALRLATAEALVMLLIMAVVFLAWSFVWLRGEMLYPAVLMVTLAVLAVWHNKVHPTQWDAYRLSINALVMGVSALVWLGVGNRLHAIRGEIFNLAAPARACSAILGLVGLGFAVALALSPAFGGDVWRQARTLADWALGLATLSSLILYFSWAGFVLQHRFYSLVSALVVLLLGLYIGLYVGVRLSTGTPLT